MTIAEELESKLKHAFSAEDDQQRLREVTLCMVLCVRDVTGITRVQNGMLIHFADGSAVRVSENILEVEKEDEE